MDDQHEIALEQHMLDLSHHDDKNRTVTLMADVLCKIIFGKDYPWVR